MSKSINTLTASLEQCANMILTAGSRQTILIRGEPGCGKSTLLRDLAKSMPDYLPCYIDVANLDLGDIAMPVVNRDKMVTNYAPNARFGIASDQKRPVLLMLDELGKASRPVLNMLLPLILERRLGDIELPMGSVVFGTTNLDTDGIQDNIPAHAYNRMTVVRVAKPSADQWVAWGMDNGVVPEVLAFAKQYPQVFNSYTDLDANDTNPYIFNPIKGQIKSFTSPRSLAAASVFVESRAALGDALLPALAGTIGDAAARDMEAMLALSDTLPSFEAIVKAPATTKLPTSPAALFILVFMLAARVEADSMDAVMEYGNRIKDESFEAYSLLVATIASGRKVAMAVRNREFTKAAASVGKYF